MATVWDYPGQLSCVEFQFTQGEMFNSMVRAAIAVCVENTTLICLCMGVVVNDCVQGSPVSGVPYGTSALT